MQVIDMLDNDKKDTKWIIDQFNAELLVVDQSFQRRYVWLEKHQIKLVETILLGFAIPEIYLWVTNTDATTGNTKYSIVDGQQRIGALVDYINDKYKLNKYYLENQNSQFANKKFSQLDDEDKKIIWKYRFSIRVIKQEVDRENIIKLFLRLNSTDKSLNPQELRNAEFNGKFLELANEISENEFWAINRIFSTDNLRRMDDVEFISSVLIFLRLGIESEITQFAINQAYDLFNEEYNEAQDDKEMFLNILREIQRLVDASSNILPFIRKTTHLYVLMVVAYQAICVNHSFTQENIMKIIAFILNYQSDNQYPMFVEYKKLSSAGTQAKQNRLKRIAILTRYIGLIDVD